MALLKWALIMLVVSLLAALFGFTDLAAASGRGPRAVLYLPRHLPGAARHGLDGRQGGEGAVEPGRKAARKRLARRQRRHLVFGKNWDGVRELARAAVKCPKPWMIVERRQHPHQRHGLTAFGTVVLGHRGSS